MKRNDSDFFWFLNAVRCLAKVRLNVRACLAGEYAYWDPSLNESSGLCFRLSVQYWRRSVRHWWARLFPVPALDAEAAPENETVSTAAASGRIEPMRRFYAVFSLSERGDYYDLPIAQFAFVKHALSWAKNESVILGRCKIIDVEAVNMGIGVLLRENDTVAIFERGERQEACIVL